MLWGDALTQRRAASSETSFPSGGASNQPAANAAAVRATVSVEILEQTRCIAFIVSCPPPKKNNKTHTDTFVKQLTGTPNLKNRNVIVWCPVPVCPLVYCQLHKEKRCCSIWRHTPQQTGPKVATIWSSFHGDLIVFSFPSSRPRPITK